jgi:hypothetical protein
VDPPGVRGTPEGIPSEGNPLHEGLTTQQRRAGFAELANTLEGRDRNIWAGIWRTVNPDTARWLLSDPRLWPLVTAFIERFRPHAGTLARKLWKANEEHGLDRVIFALERAAMSGKSANVLDRLLAEGPKETPVIPFPSIGRPRTSDEANEKLKADFEHGLAVLEALAGGAA